MRQKTKRKNGGFTLVEILIAMTILGIIVVPFMHSFVTASRTNAKAKKLQNATQLASNLMEEVKANSIEDLAFQFNYPLRADGTNRFDIIDADSFDTSGVAEVLLSGDTYTKPTLYQVNGTSDNRDLVSASVLYEGYQDGSSEEYEYLGQDSGKYYFMMTDVSSGTGTYDALITMDAAAYKTNAVVEENKGHNDKTSPVIDSVDVRKDAFYVPAEEDMIEFAANKIVEEAGAVGASVDPETLYDENLSNGELQRTIIITINKTNNLTTVKRSYKYKIVGGSLAGHTYPKSGVDNTETIYSNEESPGYELRTIYLFYTPNYASNTCYSGVADQFIIQNPDNVEADLYIVKQKYSSFNTSIYKAKESAYYCKVTVLEDVDSYTPSQHDAYLSLRTNLGENIYDESTALYYGYELTYNNIEESQPNQTSAKKILDEKSLDAEQERDRIYDVTVEIYESGAAAVHFVSDPIATITGSKDN